MKTIIDWFIDKSRRKLRIKTAADGSLVLAYGYRGEAFDDWLAKRKGVAQ